MHDESALREQVAALREKLRAKESAYNDLVARTIRTQEEERRHIALYLHDELAQTLTGLSMSIDAAVGQLSGRELPSELWPLVAQLERTREIVDESLSQTRVLILELRPPMLDDLGLVPAIRWFSQTVLSPMGALVAFRTSGRQRRLSPHIETTLFRIVQEALANVARHSEAEHVKVRVAWSDDAIAIRVADDGRGFDPSERATTLGAHSVGLEGMRERAGMIGAELMIDSAAGRGTVVEVLLPLA